MTTNIQSELAEAAERYRQRQAERDDAMAVLAATIQAADEAGMTATEIQEVTGVARQTVYKAMTKGDRVRLSANVGRRRVTVYGATAAEAQAKLTDALVSE